MAQVTISPEARIRTVADALQETEFQLEAKGVPVYYLRTWLTQTLLLRDLQRSHDRGELESVTCDEEDLY